MKTSALIIALACFIVSGAWMFYFQVTHDESRSHLLGSAAVLLAAIIALCVGVAVNSP
jgi:hypothetical protein